MQTDKKKMLIVGVLLLAMVTIGVFQFSGSSAPAPKKEEAKKSTITEKVTAKVTPPGSATEGSTEDPSAGGTAKVASNDSPIITELSERDPFDGHLYDPKPVQQKAPAAAAPNPRTSRGPGNVPPIPVEISGGSFTATPGGAGVLPNAGGAPTAVSTPVKPPEEFNYTVSGVVSGDRPAAVFVDDKGNQRLVTLGSSIDGDSKLISVARGKVTVRLHNGKTQTLSVGNPK